MSELKVHKAYNRWIDEEMPTPNDDLICNEVYLKSEADKVIAKLNNRIKFLQVTHSACCNHCNECADGMGKVFDETLDELKKQKEFILEHATEVIRRQKYKRCLAMAKWCKTSALCDEGLGAFKYRDWYRKWFKRWMKLAEKFKDKEA